MTDVISTPPRRYWLASQHPTADRKACQIGRGVPPHRRKGSATRPKRKRPPRRSRNWWLNWSSSVGDRHFKRATRGHSPRILAARRPRSAAPDSLVSWLSTPVCTLVEGHVGTAIAQLKEMDGPEIQVQGSGNLVQTLLSEDLVDGLHLLFIQSCSAGASGCSRRALSRARSHSWSRRPRRAASSWRDTSAPATSPSDHSCQTSLPGSRNRIVETTDGRHETHDQFDDWVWTLIKAAGHRSLDSRGGDLVAAVADR